ncbi:hypothetical protein JZ751_016301 [Albula glossodonta]|uniref:Uncharacterized protein n=1 Tax=Albula glossodonta TaxID=121402 RepID=A0A8T2MWK1_9TELE|nr:hypothetical protein JZ751_016301 [Albula glossodonta]
MLRLGLHYTWQRGQRPLFLSKGHRWETHRTPRGAGSSWSPCCPIPHWHLCSAHHSHRPAPAGAPAVPYLTGISAQPITLTGRLQPEPLLSHTSLASLLSPSLSLVGSSRSPCCPIPHWHLCSAHHSHRSAPAGAPAVPYLTGISAQPITLTGRLQPEPLLSHTSLASLLSPSLSQAGSSRSTCCPIPHWHLCSAHHSHRSAPAGAPAVPYLTGISAQPITLTGRLQPEPLLSHTSLASLLSPSLSQAGSSRSPCCPIPHWYLCSAHHSHRLAPAGAPAVPYLTGLSAQPITLTGRLQPEPLLSHTSLTSLLSPSLSQASSSRSPCCPIPHWHLCSGHHSHRLAPAGAPAVPYLTGISAQPITLTGRLQPEPLLSHTSLASLLSPSLSQEPASAPLIMVVCPRLQKGLEVLLIRREWEIPSTGTAPPVTSHTAQTGQAHTTCTSNTTHTTHTSNTTHTTYTSNTTHTTHTSNTTHTTCTTHTSNTTHTTYTSNTTHTTHTSNTTHTIHSSNTTHTTLTTYTSNTTHTTHTSNTTHTIHTSNTTHTSNRAMELTRSEGEGEEERHTDSEQTHTSSLSLERRLFETLSSSPPTPPLIPHSCIPHSQLLSSYSSLTPALLHPTL